ncbi:hypothetical protein WMF31_12315 [Sorangium sp. So ce1036]|uniref:hypothetical protein n=1 Tax=Sorangium sp. So ce1036 TaxID=3133328 RepID=UPI003EFCCB59
MGKQLSTPTAILLGSAMIAAAVYLGLRHGPAERAPAPPAAGEEAPPRRGEPGAAVARPAVAPAAPADEGARPASAPAVPRDEVARHRGRSTPIARRSGRAATRRRSRRSRSRAS